MNKRMNIPKTLYDDEVVCFIAGRYHTTPQKVIQYFLSQDGIISNPEEKLATFHLENNEMEILRGLIHNGHS